MWNNLFLYNSKFQHLRVLKFSYENHYKNKQKSLWPKERNKKISKVIIEVRGGLVQAVFARRKEIEVEVIDWDETDADEEYAKKKQKNAGTRSKKQKHINKFIKNDKEKNMKNEKDIKTKVNLTRLNQRL